MAIGSDLSTTLGCSLEIVRLTSVVVAIELEIIASNFILLRQVSHPGWWHNKNNLGYIHLS
jgi:hypothetical protein